MAKKIITPDSDLVSASGETLCSDFPKVVGVKPTGNQVMIEILTQQELMSTLLEVPNEPNMRVPLQGYVRAVGPSVRCEDWGFAVGDRVLLSGTGVMVPKYDDNHRERFFMEPSAIKSVLIEG